MLLPVLYNLNTAAETKTKSKILQCSVRNNHFNADISNDSMLPSFKSSILTFMQMQMKDKFFIKEAMTPDNPKWVQAIKRCTPIEKKDNEIRSDFERDRDRIVHSEGFDRMRLKTQVFPLCENDMISTRSSHVLQVTDIARNICRKLGLNEELAEAIGLGHDIGHSPFGHDGERSLKTITQKEGLPLFWHEKNSLRMTDKILTLTNSHGEQNNLGLTYAVRDGIINHCGEIDENHIKPRNTAIDLESITEPGKIQPYTWEGIIVKISDKIAYLGKDIEDAYRLGLYNEKNREELKDIVRKHIPDFSSDVNNTVLINIFVNDLIKNSDTNKGIGFSKPVFELMKDIKDYNYKNIYKLKGAKELSQEECDKIIFSIYENFKNLYKGKDTIDSLSKSNNKYIKIFSEWLIKYSDNKYHSAKYKNVLLYDLNNIKDYKQAIVDYISGMTDKYAMNTYKSLT